VFATRCAILALKSLIVLPQQIVRAIRAISPLTGCFEREKAPWVFQIKKWNGCFATPCRTSTVLRLSMMCMPRSGGYKLALIRTSHKSAWHRIMCWAGDKESLAREASLLRAEEHAKDVLGKSPEHRLALERIVRSQPDDIARKDNLLSLLRGSIEP
jgi:hypothetical protein